MKRTFAVALSGASTLLLTGCPAGGGSDYSGEHPGAAQEYRAGDHVRVLSGGGVFRVTP